MAPLLSGDELLHTDAKEAAYDPFRRVETDDIIDLLSAALKSIGIGNKKKGKEDHPHQGHGYSLGKVSGRYATDLLLCCC